MLHRFLTCKHFNNTASELCAAVEMAVSIVVSVMALSHAAFPLSSSTQFRIVMEVVTGRGIHLRELLGSKFFRSKHVITEVPPQRLPLVSDYRKVLKPH
jgi:hypothetical protein